MKKVLVWSKSQFDDIMKYNGLQDDNIESIKSAFISINDTAGRYSQSWFNQDHLNVLVLHFDDVESDKETSSPTNNISVKAFTEEQAKKIISFLEDNKEKNTFIIHCAAGISRSGAVGLFINDYFKLLHSDFKRNNPFVQPNGHISRTLNNLYHGRKDM